MSCRSWGASTCASGRLTGEAMNLFEFCYGIIHWLVDLVNHLWYWLGDVLPWAFGDFFTASRGLRGLARDDGHRHDPARRDHHRGGRARQCAQLHMARQEAERAHIRLLRAVLRGLQDRGLAPEPGGRHEAFHQGDHHAREGRQARVPARARHLRRLVGRRYSRPYP